MYERMNVKVEWDETRAAPVARISSSVRGMISGSGSRSTCAQTKRPANLRTGLLPAHEIVGPDDVKDFFKGIPVKENHQRQFH